MKLNLKSLRSRTRTFALTRTFAFLPVIMETRARACCVGLALAARRFLVERPPETAIFTLQFRGAPPL
eukprot:scaffold10205_cov215-Skeletonema_marinoi.AAC.8